MESVGADDFNGGGIPYVLKRCFDNSSKCFRISLAVGSTDGLRRLSKQIEMGTTLLQSNIMRTLLHKAIVIS